MAYTPQYGPGSTSVAENRRKYMNPGYKLENVRSATDEDLVLIMGHRAPGSAYPSAHPPLAPSPYGRLFRDGHPWVWMTRCATALLLLLVVGIVGLVAYEGLSAFWPHRLVRYQMKDGAVVVGEELDREVHRTGVDERREEQVFVRVGNRDVMRVRPFIRISGNLAMATSDLSAKIPPFNAQRMLTDVGTSTPAAAEDPNNPDAIEPDAEVSFVTRDLAPILPKAKLAAVVALDEVMMRVRDASNWRGNSGVRYTALANATAYLAAAARNCSSHDQAITMCPAASRYTVALARALSGSRDSQSLPVTSASRSSDCLRDSPNSAASPPASVAWSTVPEINP